MASRVTASRSSRARGLGSSRSNDHLDGGKIGSTSTAASSGTSAKVRASRVPVSSAAAAAAGGTLCKAPRSGLASLRNAPLHEVTNRSSRAPSAINGNSSVKDGFEKQPPAKTGSATATVTKVRTSRVPTSSSHPDSIAHHRKRSGSGSTTAVAASSSSSNLASIRDTAARMNAAMEIDEEKEEGKGARSRTTRLIRQPPAKRVVRKATSAITVRCHPTTVSSDATVHAQSDSITGSMDVDAAAARPSSLHADIKEAKLHDEEEEDNEQLEGGEEDDDLHDSELEELEGVPSDTEDEDAAMHGLTDLKSIPQGQQLRAPSSSAGSASDISSAVPTAAGTAETTPWMNSNEKFDDQADVFAEEVEVNFDPECIIHIRPEFVDAAEHKKAHIIRKYDETVIRPQAEEARQQRQALLLNGQISQETAALDDELALMGLDPDEVRDTTMVAEYSEEIFAYMSECEMSTMAKPNYMDFQTEIQWYMRQTLVDWLLQVHVRYHMLPETLWIAVNIIDRFLSMRVVALQKLQLVGVTSMFIAAKYEEILAPSVEEFVFMTENGYSKEEILKGERIILSTLDFNISKYCTPYSWLRRISKADDYDIHSRTLAKFLMEVTLTDHRFLRAKPSMIAAMSMLLAKKMLGLEWNDAFVYYSKFTEQELVPGANLMLEKLIDPSFEEQFVCKKYSNRKFLKASIYAREWALQNHRSVAAAAAAEAGEEYDTSV